MPSALSQLLDVLRVRRRRYFAHLTYSQRFIIVVDITYYSNS